jgi:hypothetical protein
MKQSILIVLFTLTCLSTFSQSKVDPKWSEQYYKEEWSASSLSKLIDVVKFKPVSSVYKGADMKFFKVAILQLNQPDIEQMNRDAWYLCSTKHDDYFEVWNMFYSKITKEYWDKNCKGLVALMCLDNTANPR